MAHLFTATLHLLNSKWCGYIDSLHLYSGILFKNQSYYVVLRWWLNSRLPQAESHIHTSCWRSLFLMHKHIPTVGQHMLTHSLSFSSGLMSKGRKAAKFFPQTHTHTHIFLGRIFTNLHHVRNFIFIFLILHFGIWQKLKQQRRHTHKPICVDTHAHTQDNYCLHYTAPLPLKAQIMQNRKFSAKPQDILHVR